ncbi:MAG: F0F1 ATP synthase subunit epsilon [Nitrospirae bacterium]|nr:F0F1 ATP synthase subunit epsilon [Nitrospirota bacterium]
MENKIRLEIVTPHGLVFSEDVDEVTAAGSEGEFGVLPGHSPFITTLKVGMLTCRGGSEVTHFFVNWGYTEVGHDKVLVLADSSERSIDIDVQRAQLALKRAEERLKKDEEIDFIRAQSALERALMRIQVSGKKGQGTYRE